MNLSKSNNFRVMRFVVVAMVVAAVVIILVFLSQPKSISESQLQPISGYTLVVATNGTVGYVSNEDMERESNKQNPKPLDVYDKDLSSLVGQFVIESG